MTIDGTPWNKRIHTKPRIEMNSEGNSKLWPQWFSAITINILALLHGLSAGWSSPYLAKLTSGAEILVITSDEASWIVSLGHLSRPLGSVIGGAIAYKYGSRKGLLFGGVPHGIAWSCYLIQETVPLLYASRVLSGIAIGMYLSSFPIYIGEIGNPRIRGSLVAVVLQGAGIGYLVGNILGAYLPMKTFAIIGLTMSIIFISAFALVPDSSHYLIRRNQLQDAEKSLKWYDRKEDVRVELDALIVYIGKPRNLSVREKFMQLLTPLNRKVLMNILFLHALIYIGGIHIIRMYMEILLTTLKINVINPSLAVICTAIVAIIGGLITTYTNDRFGRRTMLAFSAVVVAIIFTLIGINFMLIRNGYDISSVQWLTIAEFMSYMFFVNIGLVGIPCCLVSEIFPNDLKEFGACGANVVSAFTAFVAAKNYQSILNATSEEFIFFFYAFILLVVFIYTLVFIPETKGKSLREIQEILMKGNQRIVKVEELNDNSEL